jgi:type IV pilus assembly protein PilC
VSKKFSTGICFAKTIQELSNITSDKGCKLVSCKPIGCIFKKSIANIETFSLPFFRSLHTLVSNNIDITQALQIITKSFKKEEHQAITKYLIYKISSGKTIHATLTHVDNANIFDQICIKTIEVAEKTATLPQALEHIIKYLEDNIATRKLIKCSMWYPALLLITILFVAVFWIFAIIPAFAESFASFGQNLPRITKILLLLRDFCANHIFIVCGVCALFVYAAIKKRSFFLNASFLKKINRNLRALRFFHSMTIMLKEKIDFMDALLSSSISSQDKHFENGIKSVRRSIESGVPLSAAFKQSGLFSEQEIAILIAGDQAGTLPGTFEILFIISQRNVKDTIDRITAMFQPIATIIMGGILLVIIYSVFIPMYDQLSPDL